MEPFSREDILTALEQVHARGVAYWNTLSTRVFFDPIGTAWSPADHVRHLNKAISAVTRGLSLPRPILALLFGRPARASRHFQEIRETYHDVLAAGGNAGRFAVSSTRHGSMPDVDRARIMTAHRGAVHALRDRIAGLSDHSLDRYRLPHPLLGKLTLREMLLFTLLHNQHHVDVARRRFAENVEKS